MPKPTFFRLEEDKQQKILDAAITEFSIEPLHKASVANIIKLAEIPRGSFYQYFEDKEDLFYYLFDLLRKEPEEYFLTLFKEKKGDLLQTFVDYFDYYIGVTVVGEHAKLFRNMFMHMNFKHYNEVFVGESETKILDAHRKMHVKDKRQRYQEIASYVDYSKLTISSEKELKILIRLLFTLMSSSINDAYRVIKPVEIDVVKLEFKTKMDWIKNGLYQKEEENV